MFAHRVAWVLVHGPIPDGLDVLHRCDNRRCVHTEPNGDGCLFLGTHQDNMADMAAKGRAARGERVGCSRFTDADVREMRRLHQEGWSAKDIGARFLCHGSQVTVIVHRKRWTHVE